MNTEANKQIIKDLKNVAHDAEELVKATAGDVSDSLQGTSSPWRCSRDREGDVPGLGKESCGSGKGN